MWGVSLKENIRHFVRLFGLVKKDQIIRFFQDQDTHAVNFFLEDMIRSRELFEHENGCVSEVKKLPYPDYFYDDSMRAVSVLCTFRSSEITFIHRAEYPTRVIFLTTEHKLYDVTVFPPEHMDWQGELTAAIIARNATIPDKMDDVTEHIAVVDSIQSRMVMRLIEFNYTIFATVDNDGNAITYTMSTGD